jgi:hypothetical protein
MRCGMRPELQAGRHAPLMARKEPMESDMILVPRSLRVASCDGCSRQQDGNEEMALGGEER